ncbi:hypothetical protein FJR48_07300 [Sulfurimonas lithotrophica]|uniref:Uncharacterized protein n=1 Tax=Sulfurimonas lithotrophica TaxID=2590022 RepID=A0A5P8P1E6_9BACT|nr:hypothetical protein [Sulfurimonas lithotrophica]QFR49548.1 hypothetical protein FJR48_07300 [Sulfurimonas lithotrophica]
MKKVLGLFFGLYLLYSAYDVYISGRFSPDGYYEIELGVFKYLVTSVFALLGFLVVYKTINRNEKISVNNETLIEYSKCPKCKKSYNYSELKDGMCPTCNVKTIEMEEYFKKYPEELNDV